MRRLALLLLLATAGLGLTVRASAQSMRRATEARIAAFEDSVALLQTKLEVDTLSTEARESLAARLSDARDSLARATEMARDTSAVNGADAPEAPFYTRWWFWALLVALALSVVAAVLASRRAGSMRTSARTRQASSAAVPTGAQITARDQASGASSPFASTQNLDTLRRAVQQNQEQIAALAERLGRFERQAQIAQARPAPEPVAEARPAPASRVETAAQAFLAWCQQGTPLMNRADFFEKHLRASLPEATVRTVFLDSYSQATTVRFDSQGGAAPVDFWLVTAGTDAVVFPQPLNAGQFRDLARVFEGAATPQTVRTVEPARVREDGDAFVLLAAGRVG